MSLTPRAVKVTPIKDTMQDQIGSVDHVHTFSNRGRNLLALSGTSTKLREGQPSAAKGWWIRRKAGKSSTETHEQQEDNTYSK